MFISLVNNFPIDAEGIIQCIMAVLLNLYTTADDHMVEEDYNILHQNLSSFCNMSNTLEIIMRMACIGGISEGEKEQLLRRFANDQEIRNGQSTANGK